MNKRKKEISASTLSNISLCISLTALIISLIRLIMRSQ